MMRSFYRSDDYRIALSSAMDGESILVERFPATLNEAEARELAAILIEWSGTGSLAPNQPDKTPPAPRVKRKYTRRAKAHA